MNRKLTYGAILVLVSLASGVLCLADDDERCDGYVNWTWSSESTWPTLDDIPDPAHRADSTYGLCDYPGHYIYTRTLGTCVCDPGSSCTTGSYARKMDKWVHSVQVSAEEQAICDQQYQNDLSTLEALRGACIAVGGADCLAGCALFIPPSPAYVACATLCGGAIAVACEAAFLIDKANLDHELSDCKWDCVDEPYVYSDYATGCIG